MGGEAGGPQGGEHQSAVARGPCTRTALVLYHNRSFKQCLNTSEPIWAHNFWNAKKVQLANPSAVLVKFGILWITGRDSKRGNQVRIWLNSESESLVQQSPQNCGILPSASSNAGIWRLMNRALEPACKVSVLSKKSWPYKRAGLTSGL